MLSNYEQKERKSRIAAVAGTLVFHAVILALLLLLALHTALPLPAEQGVEVIMDYSNNSMEIVKNQASDLAGTVTKTDPETVDKKLIAEKSDENPAISKTFPKIEKHRELPKIRRAPIVEIPDIPAINHKAIYPGRTDQNPSGVNHENNNTSGEPFKPDGTNNGVNNEANINNIQYNLDGRKSKSLPKPVYDSPEQGKIVVSIKVDRDGKVTYASSGAKGTTITEIKLRKQAENAARLSLFETATNAPSEQKGTITYIFLKQK